MAAAASTLQYVTSPAQPTTTSSQWLNWERIGTGLTGNLASLVPKRAYLVHSSASTVYTWNLKGKPMAPAYTWSTSGENFLGFPTAPVNPPKFDAFLSYAPSLMNLAEIYQYQGGALNSTNPSQVFNVHNTAVTRGQAFWVRAGDVFQQLFRAVHGGVAGHDRGRFWRLVEPIQSSPAQHDGGGRDGADEIAAFGNGAGGVWAAGDCGGSAVAGAGGAGVEQPDYTYTNLASGGTVSWTLPPQGQNGSDMVVVLGLNPVYFDEQSGGRFTRGFCNSRTAPVTRKWTRRCRRMWLRTAGCG